MCIRAASIGLGPVGPHGVFPGYYPLCREYTFPASSRSIAIRHAAPLCAIHCLGMHRWIICLSFKQQGSPSGQPLVWSFRVAWPCKRGFSAGQISSEQNSCSMFLALV